MSKVQKEQILDLWNIEYPMGLLHRHMNDFDAYLEGLMEKSYILLLNEQEHVIGCYIDFNREQDRWFAMILDANYQGKGWAGRF